MKLVRFGATGREAPGIWDNGRIMALRDVFPQIPDIDGQFFAQGWLEKIAGIDAEGAEMGARLGPPVARPSKIICLGKNYTEHTEEWGTDKPDQPLLFSKSPNALNGPFDPIELPQSSRQVDWEVELALVIGKQGKRISRERAFDHIAGYTVMNDVSGRDVQYAEGQWYRGKSFDTFAPLGPCLVTADEIGDVHRLKLSTEVDGVIMQEGTTADMIFDIPTIIENVSQDITLVPGDIISTGTPAGVGIFRDPPILLQPGSVVKCTVEGIGTIINECR